MALLRKTTEWRRELQSQFETSVKLLAEKAEAEESGSAALNQRRMEEVANRCVRVEEKGVPDRCTGRLCDHEGGEVV